jgi:monofunctional biosynthetic peptidoglycan transglycosylase
VKKALRFLGWLALAAAGIFLAVQLSFLARVWWWRDHNPQMTAFMEIRLEELRARQRDARIVHAGLPTSASRRT